MFCRSLFFLLYLFFLSFFDLPLMITPLVSSNSSKVHIQINTCPANENVADKILTEPSTFFLIIASQM